MNTVITADIVMRDKENREVFKNAYLEELNDNYKSDLSFTVSYEEDTTTDLDTGKEIDIVKYTITANQELSNDDIFESGILFRTVLYELFN